MPGRRKRDRQTEYFFDYSLLLVVLFLLGFGLIMIYSTSSYNANLEYNDSAYYLKKQAFAAALGLMMMVIVAKIPYHFWEPFATLGYIVSAVLILLVQTPLGMESHGARRWLRIGGMSLQPAEIAKLGMILFLASLVCKMGKSIRSLKGFCIVMCVPLPICLMVWQITDNLSSAIIIFGIAILMLFVASPDYKKFILTGLAGLAGAALLVYIISQQEMGAEGIG